MSYKIFNRTDLVQEVEVEIEPSESFIFSGNSQVRTFNREAVHSFLSSKTSKLNIQYMLGRIHSGKRHAVTWFLLQMGL